MVLPLERQLHLGSELMGKEHNRSVVLARSSYTIGSKLSEIRTSLEFKLQNIIHNITEAMIKLLICCAHTIIMTHVLTIHATGVICRILWWWLSLSNVENHIPQTWTIYEYQCNPVHCKYIRPDYDGTLAIHRSTIVVVFICSVPHKKQKQKSDDFVSQITPLIFVTE